MRICGHKETIKNIMKKICKECGIKEEKRERNLGRSERETISTIKIRK